VLDLSDHGVMTLIGPDARRFCNGMFTNNVRDLQPGQANLSAMVDDKARIQGLLDLWCLEPASFAAVLEGVTPEAFEARYSKYIIFDDVELTEVSDETTLLGVQGPAAAAVLARAGLPAPEAEGAHVAADLDGVALRVLRRSRSVAGGFDLLAPVAALGAIAARVREAGAEPLGPDAVERLRVEAGIARWPLDMGERALPHELRLVERMCSFNKGCYIGQEVINRIDVMGQVQKKLWGLEMPAVPAPNTPVLLEGAAVGHTLSGVDEEGRARVLAILRKAAWTPGAVVEVEGVGPAVVRDLPFGA
jgi:folate-binding protein YgfZ